MHPKSAVLASKQLLSRLNISDLGERLKLVEHIKAQEYEEAISMIDAYDPVQETCDPLKKAFFRLGSCTGGPIVRGSLKQAMEDAQNVTNHQFVGQLDTISMEYPVLARTAVEARSALYAPLTRRISSLVDSLAVRLSQTQALDVSCDLMKVLVAKREEMLDYAHKVFLDELASLYTNETRWAPFFLYQYAITHIPLLVRILSLLTTSYARTLETRTWRDYTHGGAVTGSKEP